MANANMQTYEPAFISPPDNAWRGGNKLFSLALVDLDRLNDADEVDDALLDYPEFVFPYNPQSLQRDSNPSVNITATPGGMISTHNGNLSHNYRVEGTFGLRPERALSAAPSVLGIPVPDILGFGPEKDASRGIPYEEHTGHDYTVDLLNLEAAYYAARADPKRTHKVALVWKDALLGEFYIVEFLKPGIQVVRDRQNRMHWRYSFTLQTLQRLDDFVATIETVDDEEPGGWVGFINRMRKIAYAIQSTMNFVNAVVNRVAGLARATVNSFLSIGQAVVDAFQGFTAAAGRLASIPRETVLRATALAQQAWEQINTWQRGLDEPAAWRAAIATVKREFGVAQQGFPTPYHEEGTIGPKRQLSQALMDAKRLFLRMLAEDRLFAQPHSAAMSRLAETMPARRRAPLGAPVARQARIGAADTLAKLALRLLGNADLQQELAELNNLRYPYIAPDGDGRSVLRPGDAILYPSRETQRGESQIGMGSAGSSSVATLEDRLGVDLLLQDDSEGHADLVLTHTGDIATVEGYENVTQALSNRFRTPLRELPGHPYYGDMPLAGKKANKAVRSIAEAQMFTRGQFMQDRRVRRVRRLAVRLAGNTLARAGEVDLIGGDEPLQFSFVPGR